MRGQRRWATAVATLATVIGLVGCGGSSGGGSVKDGLLSGVDGLVKADRLTTTFRLDTTSADVQGLAQAGGDTLNPKIASAIAGADIVVETVRGDGGTDLDLRGVA